VQQNISYKRELLAGDIVEVRSFLLEVRDKAIRFVHEMRNAETGEVCAICELTGVHVDRKVRKSVGLCRADPRGCAKASGGRRARDGLKRPDGRCRGILANLSLWLIPAGAGVVQTLDLLVTSLLVPLAIPCCARGTDLPLSAAAVRLCATGMALIRKFLYRLVLCS